MVLEVGGSKPLTHPTPAASRPAISREPSSTDPEGGDAVDMLEERILSRHLVPLCKPTFHRLLRAARPHSMVDPKRMQNIWRLLQRLERDGVEGDLVELGVAGGGTGLVLAGAAEHSRLSRQVWLYDAFEQSEDFDFKLEDVQRLINVEHGHDPKQVHVIEGFFEDVLPSSGERPLALVHIDAGGYQPILDSLNWVHPRMAAGGWVVFDNYGVSEDCRRAFEDYRASHDSVGELIRFRHTQAYFQVVRI